MSMAKELDKAQAALAQAREVLAALDYATERVNHIKFERSSDGVWWFRVTAERMFMAEGMMGAKDTKFETVEQVIKGREDSAMSLLMRVYGERISNYGKGIKD